MPPEAIDQPLMLSSISVSVGSILSLISVRRSFSPGKASRIVLCPVRGWAVLAEICLSVVLLSSLGGCMLNVVSDLSNEAQMFACSVFTLLVAPLKLLF